MYFTSLKKSFRYAVSTAFIVSFCAAAQDDLSDWTYKAKVFLNTTSTGAGVTADVTDFPVAVQLGAANFDFTQAQENGEDVRFTNEAGDILPHEIEGWDSDGRVAAVWVLVDMIEGNNDEQFIWMHWGNADAEDASDGKAVFKREDGYVGVWHLSDEPGNAANGYKDATSTEAHGKGFNMTEAARTDGVVYKCVDLDDTAGGDTAGQYIEISKEPEFDLVNAVTLFVWVNIEEWNRVFQSILTKGDQTYRLLRAGPECCIWNMPGTTIEWTCNTGIGKVSTTDPIDNDKWRLIVGTYNRQDLLLYVDGEFDFIYENQTDPLNNQDYPVRIGKCAQPQKNAPDKEWGEHRQFNGMMDEVRILDVAVSEDYAKLSWENQKPEQTLVTVDNEVGVIEHALSSMKGRGGPAAGAQIKVFDSRGRLVTSADNVTASRRAGFPGWLGQGSGKLSNGVYVARLDAGGRLVAEKHVAKR
jgi:hypothetical protein